MIVCTYCKLDESDPRIEIGHPEFDEDLRLRWIVAKMYHVRNLIDKGACKTKSQISPNVISTYFD